MITPIAPSSWLSPMRRTTVSAKLGSPRCRLATRNFPLPSPDWGCKGLDDSGTRATGLLHPAQEGKENDTARCVVCIIVYSQRLAKSRRGRDRQGSDPLECTKLCRCERTVRTGWEIVQHERAKPHAREFLDPIADRFAHPPYLAVAPFAQGHLHPGFLLARVQDSHLSRG